MALRIAFGPDKRFLLCGVAHDFPAAIEVIPDVDPQLVLLDINLRSGSGLDVIASLLPSRVRSLVFSQEDPRIWPPSHELQGPAATSATTLRWNPCWKRQRS